MGYTYRSKAIYKTVPKSNPSPFPFYLVLISLWCLVCLQAAWSIPIARLQTTYVLSFSYTIQTLIFTDRYQ
jgi:hypothetical protein